MTPTRNQFFTENCIDTFVRGAPFYIKTKTKDGGFLCSGPYSTYELASADVGRAILQAEGIKPINDGDFRLKRKK